MLTATSGLANIRAHYTGDSRDLLKVLLNSTSATEANLAIEVLAETVPEKTLVAAANLREVLRAMPSTPFSMRVDEQVLARTAGLERNMAAMSKRLDCGAELAVTTAGNLVLDIIVKHDDRKSFWNPVPVTDDYLNDDVLDQVVETDGVLDAVIDLVNCMGCVWNPKFYLSLEDWHLDYAADVFEGLGDLF